MNQNIIASVLYIIGVAVMVIGLLMGLVLATEEYIVYDAFGVEQVQTGFSFILFLLWMIGGMILGMLFIGLAEIIKILHAIHWDISSKSMDRIEDEMREISQISSSTWELEEAEIQKIHDLFDTDHIIDIIPSAFEGYCVVLLKNSDSEFLRVVDIRGFGAQEVPNGEFRRKVIAWYNKQ